MHYAKVKYVDTANGTGVRISLYVSGCTRQCKGCFNIEAWDFQYGEPYTAETQKKILNQLRKNYIAGLSVLGGDPFEPRNTKDVLGLLREVKKYFPDKPTWVYTGLTWAEVMGRDDLQELLKYIDVLVDGPFIVEKKNPSLAYRGSSNQNIIDVKQSLRAGAPVFLEIGGSYGE